MNISQWYTKRFFEFRIGNKQYIGLAIALLNFVLIFYRLLIEQIEFLGNLISNLWVFLLIFLAVYIPTAILIGYWHRRTQLSTENTIKRLEDPLLAHICRIILDTRIGKSSKKEINELKEFLSEIDKGK